MSDHPRTVLRYIKHHLIHELNPHLKGFDTLENCFALTNGKYCNAESGCIGGLFNIPVGNCIVTIHPVAQMIRFHVVDASGIARYLGEIALDDQPEGVNLSLYSPTLEQDISLSLAAR